MEKLYTAIATLFAENYQLYFLIALPLTLLIGVGVLLMLKRLDGTRAKTFLKLLALVLAVALLALVAVAIIKSGSNKEYLTAQSQILLAALTAVLLLSAIIFCILLGHGEEKNTRALVFGAVLLALSMALSYVRLFKLPFGGSVTLASIVPLVLYCYMFGTRRGVLVCLIYGVMQACQDPYIVHPLQFLLDYPLAFTMLGFSAVTKKAFHTKNERFNRLAGVLSGTLLAVTLRYLCHALSGAVFFGTYGIAYGVNSALGWGFAYNSFVFVDAVPAVIVLCCLFSSNAFNNEMQKAMLKK